MEQETTVIARSHGCPGDKFYVPNGDILNDWVSLRDNLSLGAIIEMVRQDLDAEYRDPPPRLYSLLNDAREILKSMDL